jgi:glutamate-1-semialdehyde 2,1-aminomutase
MTGESKQGQALLEKARAVLPGGTFGNTAADIIVVEGKGSRVWDENGKEYIDYLIGSGPMIVGHGHPEVSAAVRDQLERGTTFFANNPQGIELAAVIVDAVPCADKVRFASTGSEADAFAIRLARAFTGRSKILKFEGGYHGYSDYGLMSLAPGKPGNSPQPIPDSAGIPETIKEDILVAPFNDATAVESLIKEHGNSIAAVFMEPLQRLIPPQPGFLEAMRELTLAHDILLVFDEVVTGFRLSFGGAQQYYGVVPDLCTLGKAIGGGFPLSAVAGREDIMALFDRSRTAADRFVPQVGTLSGNPVAAAAGLATLEILKRPGTYDRFFETGKKLMAALARALESAGLEAQVLGAPPMFDIVFAAGEVRNYRDTAGADSTKMATLNNLLRERGILKGDNKYYVSTAIDDVDVEQTIEIWSDAIAELRPN